MDSTGTVPSLGQKIRHERERLSLSIRSLARMAGISDIHLARIEKDKADPSVSVLEKIARALRKDIASFFGDLMEEMRISLLRLKGLLESREFEIYAQGSVDLSDGNTVLALIDLIECVDSKAVFAEKAKSDSNPGVVDPLEVAFVHLKDSDLKNSANFAEDLCKKMGVLIIEKPLPLELRGLCARSKRGKYCIIVNANLGEEKTRTLEHEILHILGGARSSSTTEIIEKVGKYLERISLR